MPTQVVAYTRRSGHGAADEPQNLDQGTANGEVRTSHFCGSLFASPKLLSAGGLVILPFTACVGVEDEDRCAEDEDDPSL